MDVAFNWNVYINNVSVERAEIVQGVDSMLLGMANSGLRLHKQWNDWQTALGIFQLWRILLLWFFHLNMSSLQFFTENKIKHVWSLSIILWPLGWSQPPYFKHWIRNKCTWQKVPSWCIHTLRVHLFSITIQAFHCILCAKQSQTQTHSSMEKVLVAETKTACVDSLVPSLYSLHDIKYESHPLIQWYIWIPACALQFCQLVHRAPGWRHACAAFTLTTTFLRNVPPCSCDFELLCFLPFKSQLSASALFFVMKSKQMISGSQTQSHTTQLEQMIYVLWSQLWCAYIPLMHLVYNSIIHGGSNINDFLMIVCQDVLLKFSFFHRKV